MHASLDQLLSLRDGSPVDAAISDHVQQCATCIAESARLAQMRSDLKSLPAMEAPEEFLPRIEARLQQHPAQRYAFGVAAALALVVAGAIAFVGSRDVSSSTSESAARTVSESLVAPTSEVEQLIAQSRRLEELLAYLPERPQVERVSTAATVDSLEQRIQWLDWRLVYQSDGLDERQARRLWSERVDLMDSLVKVRYAQSAPMLF